MFFLNFQQTNQRNKTSDNCTSDIKLLLEWRHSAVSRQVAQGPVSVGATRPSERPTGRIIVWPVSSRVAIASSTGRRQIRQLNKRITTTNSALFRRSWQMHKLNDYWVYWLSTPDLIKLIISPTGFMSCLPIDRHKCNHSSTQRRSIIVDKLTKRRNFTISCHFLTGFCPSLPDNVFVL